MVLKARSAAHEHKHLSKQEIEFKVLARRNRRLGLWAAEKMGLAGDDADAYAREVVLSDLDEPGDADVLRKLTGDFAAKGIDVTEQEITDRMQALLTEAQAQIDQGAT